MKLNDIAKKLKANGFVESKDKEGRMVHPEATDFTVELYYDDECDEIQIGDLYNYASFPASSIRSFKIIPKYDGIFFEIKLSFIRILIFYLSSMVFNKKIKFQINSSPGHVSLIYLI